MTLATCLLNAANPLSQGGTLESDERRLTGPRSLRLNR